MKVVLTTYKTSAEAARRIRLQSQGTDVAPPFCFVIMPFKQRFDGVYAEIRSIVEYRGIRCHRADAMAGQGVLIDNIWNSINNAAIVVADITEHNPNVFYEVGIAHALGKKTVLLSAEKGDEVPSDLCHWHLIRYENQFGGQKGLEQQLSAAIEGIVG